MAGSFSADIGRDTYTSLLDGQTVWAADIRSADIDVDICVGVCLARIGDGRAIPSDNGCPVTTDGGLGSATQRLSTSTDLNSAIPDWLFPRTEPTEGSFMPIGTDDFDLRLPAVLDLDTIDDGATSAIIDGGTYECAATSICIGSTSLGNIAVSDRASVRACAS